MKTFSQTLLSRFKAHLLEKRFFRPRQKILIACSGGPDSVALFHLLKALASEYRWRLALIHFNHKLRPRAAKTDERFVKSLARKFKVPFYGGTGDVKREARTQKISIEECARQMRYDFFLRTAKAKKIFTVVLAHTQNDQAETVLMRILQGTGLRGLQGIREKFKMGGVNLIRPFLAFTKKELLHFLHERSIPFRSDQSNDSSRFIRNRIRLKLIPVLQRNFNPRVIEALSRIPAIAAEENKLISGLETKAWQKCFKRKRRACVELRRSFFLQHPSALQFRVAEKALKKLDPQSGLSFEAWERLRRELIRPRYRCTLPKGIDFSLTPKIITIYKK
ncbi:MAG TPA: tRNA lysidine(34) synthetase TilS [Candidatus Omnitrophota bacterium]|nr:tRNA lysidine(34) synthetase TilS [Candidatus Omnitrophota bacterium]HRY84904.1 tRNA lysidine(34) synthetase TilS [Candidatus Omnitrophota bacterium]